ncbi:MAG: VCBS repeat-containing protein [Planctomycetes bacterium]|nr:VCBS repeat-containing protein [Planctomycetota bacterium]
MSPQFVDWNADGQIDIVAGTFDGSPHLSRGTDKGFAAPEQILDREGKRIVLDQFWNFDTKQWDRASRKPGEELHLGGGHATSAIAWDWDGDGDLDLLLGDHASDHVYLRRNDGTAAKPAFGKDNEALQAGGSPLLVPGTVATLRGLDWNGDGKLDLLASGMGDAYRQGEGGGVYVFLNTGDKTTTLGAPITLVPRSKKDADQPARPDSGLYVDAFDIDGDGDLDLVAGAYSHWSPKGKVLDDAQQQRVTELRAGLAEQQQKMQALQGEIAAAHEKASAGLNEAEANKKYSELYQARQPERAVIQEQLKALNEELDALVPAAKRESFVWLYENLAKGPVR